jgi:putative component of toxin-antitoxin plasmid stabilization module
LKIFKNRTTRKNAVMETDFIIVLLPAGKGIHIELGIALGQGKRVYLYSPNDEVNKFETTSTFFIYQKLKNVTELLKS